MKLDVPYYIQEKAKNCGPMALKMALSYFGKEIGEDELSEIALVEKSGVTWTQGLAKAAGELGFEVEYFSKSLGINEENYDLDYYRENADGLDENLKKEIILKKACRDARVKFYEKSLTLNEILTKVDENCIPIILLNWAKIDENTNAEYIGHFVPIVGHDENFVYIHQQSGPLAKKYFRLEKKVFEKSRKSAGTDEDIIFISKK